VTTPLLTPTWVVWNPVSRPLGFVQSHDRGNGVDLMAGKGMEKDQAGPPSAGTVTRKPPVADTSAQGRRSFPVQVHSTHDTITVEYELAPPGSAAPRSYAVGSLNR